MVTLYICYDGILDDLGQTQVLPYIFGQMKNKVGIEEVSKFLELEGGLNCF